MTVSSLLWTIDYQTYRRTSFYPSCASKVKLLPIHHDPCVPHALDVLAWRSKLGISLVDLNYSINMYYIYKMFCKPALSKIKQKLWNVACLYGDDSDSRMTCYRKGAKHSEVTTLSFRMKHTPEGVGYVAYTLMSST